MARPSSRVSRVLVTGPLAPFVEAYSVELRRRGYTERSAVGALRQVGRLSCWLEASGLSASELSRERVEQFLAWQRVKGVTGVSGRGRVLCACWRCWTVWGCAGPRRPRRRVRPIDVLLASFERYLVSERGLAAGTIVGYVSHARWFLDGLGSGGVAGLSAAEVTGAVLRKASSGVSVGATQYFVAGLRAFLRFCFVEGIVEVTCRRRRCWCRGRRASCCRAGSARSDARALLGSCDRRRPLGRRDYALIIMLLRLGLRPPRWQRSSSMTWIGGLLRWWCMAKDAATTGCPCQSTSAKRSPPGCNTAARRRPVAKSS